MNKRLIYGIMAGGGAIGMIAAFLQTTEKMSLLANESAILACDLNSIFSCTNVLSAWQSSVFGFPNSLMCMVLFTIFASISSAGASGGMLPRRLRLGVQALSIFTLMFALWFLMQSIYAIGALCILCIFCFAGLLLVNWGWMRLNVHELPIGQRGRQIVKRGVASGVDTFAWILLGLVVALAMVLRFI